MVWKVVAEKSLCFQSLESIVKYVMEGCFLERGGFQTGKAAGKGLSKGVWKGEFGGSGKVVKRAGIFRTFPIWKGDLGVAVLELPSLVTY